MSLKLSWRWMECVTSNKLSALHYCIEILSEFHLYGVHFTCIEHRYWSSHVVLVKTFIVRSIIYRCAFYGYFWSLIKRNINNIAFFYSPVFAKLTLFTFSKNSCIELIFFCMYDFTHFSVNVTWVDLGQICVNLQYWKWTLVHFSELVGTYLHTVKPLLLFLKTPWL